MQKEMWGKAMQALPAVGLLGAGACLGVLPAAASFRLSVQLLEKSLPPAVAALTAAGAAGAIGIQRLRKAQPLFPAETARDTVTAVGYDGASRQRLTGAATGVPHVSSGATAAAAMCSIAIAFIAPAPPP